MKFLRYILLTLFMGSLNLVQSQNIVLNGFIGEIEKQEIIQVVEFYFNEKKPKAINIYMGTSSVPFCKVKRKNKTRTSEVDKCLSSLVGVKSKKISTNDLNVFNNLMLSNFPKSKFIRLNKDESYIPPLICNTIEQVISAIKTAKKNENLTMLLIYNKKDASVNIISHRSNNKTNDRILTGNTKYGSVDVKEVLVSINDGEWLLARGTESWSYQMSLNQLNNNINVVVVDTDLDTSLVSKLINVKYEPIAVEANFTTPNVKKNMVPKCQGENYLFNIRLSDPSMSDEHLHLVITSQSGTKKIIPLKNRTKQSNIKSDICVSFNYRTVLGDNFVNCETDDPNFVYIKSTVPYHIELQYIFDGKMLYSSPPLKVYFSSFDQNDPFAYPPCLCR